MFKAETRLLGIQIKGLKINKTLNYDIDERAFYFKAAKDMIKDIKFRS